MLRIVPVLAALLLSACPTPPSDTCPEPTPTPAVLDIERTFGGCYPANAGEQLTNDNAPVSERVRVSCECAPADDAECCAWTVIAEICCAGDICQWCAPKE